jgi:peroxiredoxin Q/BCP
MREGDQVPDFQALDQHGRTVTLSELLEHGPLVLFFYPKAMTKGCSAESCHFRDLAADFAALGARAVGISADSVEDQARFDEAHGLGMPLLSDPDRSIASIFGVKRPGPLFNRRTTFVIGQDRRVRAAIHSELSMDRHADRALEALRAEHASRD